MTFRITKRRISVVRNPLRIREGPVSNFDSKPAMLTEVFYTILQPTKKRWQNTSKLVNTAFFHNVANQ
jgi:hypothetical protein